MNVLSLSSTYYRIEGSIDQHRSYNLVHQYGVHFHSVVVPFRTAFSLFLSLTHSLSFVFFSSSFARLTTKTTHTHRFYAKWCKKCQKVGKQLDRLAKEYGDRTIVQPPPEGEQEVFVDGSIRFGQLEYTPESKALITETLGIRGTPTLHLYVGTKLLCNGGSSATKIRNELQQIATLTPQQLCDRVESMDDGILTTIIEEAYYDSPDFLNEEW